jgi:DNA-binding Lrp family transcriptional regulator
LNQKNKDLVRRTITERILPEKFNEYLKLHQDIFPEKKLSVDLYNIIFNSKNAEEVFEGISAYRPKIINKLSEISNLREVKKDYFLRGSFPFSAKIDTQSLAMERIKNMILINIVQKDLIISGDFDAETLVRIPDLLFLLANSDEISVGKLASILSFSPNTANKILDSLVKAEIIFELKPYGQPYVQVRKSSKFLFMSSNIRAGLLNGFISREIKGKFLEDYMALIFEKEFKDKGIVLFDYAKGGADFVLRFFDKSEIVIEVGLGKETVKQVNRTLIKTKGRGKYGLIIGSGELELQDNIVKIPLDYFLLM